MTDIQTSYPEASLSGSASAEKDFPTQGVGGVIIGGDYQGLGITRSLGRRGVPVCVIDDERSIARFSRYATHAVRVKDLRDEKNTIETVMDIGRRLNLRGWVLYPTRDETVAALSQHRRVLSEFFRVPTPDWAVVRSAWDKRNTYRLAQQLGILIPKTWFPERTEDLAAIGGPFPLIIKPAIKEHFFYNTKAKAWRVNSHEELKRRFEEAAAFVPTGELMVQDFIPGGSEQQHGFSAFFKEGRPIGTMVTHNVRSHPPQLGRSSTFVETIDLPIIEQFATQFLVAIKFYGLVEVEFRLDPRDGKYKLLDVNARTWGYHSLGQACGVDFPYMLFQDQLGRPVSPSRARAGVSWVRLLTDLPVGIHGFLL
ncbi:MAG TPA: ATP-grasp domain-containing protein, partial [Patescibacteria group bacterium]|nr:ATP-grasp domain-containing protein [Patescibacteria group bacterium]